MIEKRVPFPRPIVSLLGVCPLLLLHCGPPDEQQAAGTRRMAERLEEIARNADPATHAYVNARRVKYYRDRVEHLRESVAAMDPRGKVQILNARFSYASELLRAGHSEDAVKEYRELLAVKEYRELRTEAGRRFRPTLQRLVGVSYLRLGEQENCILQHTIDSCLLPIRETGVHQAQRGSRAALREFLEVLSGNPRDLTARWLLNIAYMTLGEYPREVPSNYLIPPELFESDYDIGHFDDVAPALGLDVVGLSGGVVMEDFDGDGHLDIMASSSGLRDQLRYFRNGGDGTFADLTEQAGLAGLVGGKNALQADYDNNGYADVLILRGAWLGADGHYPNSLLSNLGDGRFVDVTEAAGLLAAHPTQTAAWGDYDNDGWVDLFVGNESVGEDTLACELFRNGGDADRDPVRFSDVAEEAGVAVVGYVKAVVWGDYDNDGLLDLYVTRLFDDEPNLLLRNEGEDAHGRWRFTDVTATAGVPGPTYSFPTWFWDYDNDGWQDIFVAGFKGDVADVAADYLGLPHDGEGPRLYRNNGGRDVCGCDAGGRARQAAHGHGLQFRRPRQRRIPRLLLRHGRPVHGHHRSQPHVSQRRRPVLSGTSPRQVGSGICRKVTASPSATSITTAIRTSLPLWVARTRAMSIRTSSSETPDTATAGSSSDSKAVAQTAPRSGRASSCA